MGIIRESDARPDRPVPGLSRLTYADRATGAGSLTTRIVTVEPGTRMTPHWHRVEEAMLVIEGAGQAILGDEILEIKAGETLLGPSGIPHGFINTGSVPMKIVVAFPAVDVETYST